MTQILGCPMLLWWVVSASTISITSQIPTHIPSSTLISWLTTQTHHCHIQYLEVSPAPAIMQAKNKHFLIHLLFSRHSNSSKGYWAVWGVNRSYWNPNGNISIKPFSQTVSPSLFKSGCYNSCQTDQTEIIFARQKRAAVTGCGSNDSDSLYCSGHITIMLSSDFYIETKIRNKLAASNPEHLVYIVNSWCNWQTSNITSSNKS